MYLTQRIVELNGIEYALAERMGRARFYSNRERENPIAKVGPQPFKQTETDSMAAELAFCKMANCYPDLSIGEAPPYDVKLYDGRTVDVKQTPYSNGKLITELKTIKKQADIYVLMTGKDKVYKYVGWAWGGKFLRKRNIGDLGYGPTFLLEQEHLHKTLEL
jgi:hypothetical protein